MSAELKKHSELSASGSERWVNCPGSVSLAREAPPEPESRYALEGTKAHELLEKWLTKKPLGVGKGKYKVDMVDAVSKAVEFVKKERKRLPSAELFVETKVSLAHIHSTMHGTADIILAEEFGELVVPDYKHGAGIAVDVEEGEGMFRHNLQLIYYALGAAHKLNYNFDSVTIGIIQPRALHHAGPVRLAKLSVPHLRRYEDIFRKGVDRVFKKTPKFHVGKWCKFCKAKPICKEFKNQADNAAAMAFANVPDEL